jgi:hypothetical protein
VNLYRVDDCIVGQKSERVVRYYLIVGDKGVPAGRPVQNIHEPPLNE